MHSQKIICKYTPIKIQFRSLHQILLSLGHYEKLQVQGFLKLQKRNLTYGIHLFTNEHSVKYVRFFKPNKNLQIYIPLVLLSVNEHFAVSKNLKLEVYEYFIVTTP